MFSYSACLDVSIRGKRDELMFLVVDTVSRNVMGECETFQEAKTLFLDLVAHHPPAAREIVILSEGGKQKDVPQDEVIAALEAVAG